jgi:hypothetical protein
MFKFFKSIFKKSNRTAAEIVKNAIYKIVDDLKIHKKYRCMNDINTDISIIKKLLSLLKEIDSKVYNEIKDDVTNEFTLKD